MIRRAISTHIAQANKDICAKRYSSRSRYGIEGWASRKDLRTSGETKVHLTIEGISPAIAVRGQIATATPSQSNQVGIVTHDLEVNLPLRISIDLPRSS